MKNKEIIDILKRIEAKLDIVLDCINKPMYIFQSSNTSTPTKSYVNCVMCGKKEEGIQGIQAHICDKCGLRRSL